MSVVLNNGVKMPFFGLGTYLLKTPTVDTIVENALQLGYKLIDTAQVYKNESEIGEVIKRSDIQREEIFITSKLGPAQQGTEGTRNAFSSSLNNLQLEYIDLYLIHWPGVSGIPVTDPRHSELRKDSWKELETLYRQEKVKAIGVSNYTVKHLEELLQYCDLVPAVLQVELHPYLTQNSLREFCAEHKIHVEAYSSLGSGKGATELMNDPVVQEVAKEQEKSSAKVLLRWALDHNMTVIPKTSTVARLKENMNVFNFSLTPSQMERLDNLDQNRRFCWDPNNIS